MKENHFRRTEPLSAWQIQMLGKATANGGAFDQMVLNDMVAANVELYLSHEAALSQQAAVTHRTSLSVNRISKSASGHLQVHDLERKIEVRNNSTAGNTSTGCPMFNASCNENYTSQSSHQGVFQSNQNSHQSQTTPNAFSVKSELQHTSEPGGLFGKMGGDTMKLIKFGNFVFEVVHSV
jgi:hypothetical protein